MALTENPVHGNSNASTAVRAVAVQPAAGPIYVDREAVSLQHFVNRYIRTRRRPVNPENRLIVQKAMGQYKGHFPARCSEVEAFLDSLLLRG